MQKTAETTEQKMAEMVSALEAICRFREFVSEERFLRIFGPGVGKHLWAKFEGINFDVLVFSRLLDTKALGKLALAIAEGKILEDDEVLF